MCSVHENLYFQGEMCSVRVKVSRVYSHCELNHVRSVASVQPIRLIELYNQKHRAIATLA